MVYILIVYQYKEKFHLYYQNTLFFTICQLRLALINTPIWSSFSKLFSCFLPNNPLATINLTLFITTQAMISSKNGDKFIMVEKFNQSKKGGSYEKNVLVYTIILFVGLTIIHLAIGL